MSLGITQLKAAASKIWSCSAYVLLSLLVEDRPDHLLGRGLRVKAHYRENPMKTPRHNTAASAFTKARVSLQSVDISQSEQQSCI